MHTIGESHAVVRLCPLSFHGNKGDNCVGGRCVAWRYVTRKRTAIAVVGQPVPEEISYTWYRESEDSDEGVCLALPFTAVNLALMGQQR